MTSLAQQLKINKTKLTTYMHATCTEDWDHSKEAWSLRLREVWLMRRLSARLESRIQSQRRYDIRVSLTHTFRTLT